ncbi:MAG: amino acid adenylation domain-containing protein [Acidimicrobiia bacterium]
MQETSLPPVAAGATRVEWDATGRIGEMSDTQLRLWIDAQVRGSGPAPLVHRVLRLSGPLDPDALIAAVHDSFRRHDALRMTFPTVDGVPAVKVNDEIDIWVERSRLGDSSPEAINAAVAALMGRTWDLEKGPLIRLGVFAIDHDDHVVALVLHHLLADGGSMPVLFAEVRAAYRARLSGQVADLGPEPASYAQWTVERAKRKQDGIIERQLDHWRSVLLPAPPPVRWLASAPSGNARSASATMAASSVAPGLGPAVRELCRTTRTSTFMVGLALVQAFMWHFADADDLLVVTPSTERDDASERMVGPAINTLPLRGRLAGHQTLADLAIAARAVVLDAFSHRDVPFETIVDELGLRPSRSVAASSVLYQWIGELRSPLGLDGVTAESTVTSPVSSASFDLAVYLSLRGDDLGVRLLHRRHVAGPAGTSTLLRAFTNLATTVLSDPNRPLADLLPRISGPQRPIASHRSVTDRIRRSAAAEPTAIAVDTPDRRMCYRDLVDDADRIAAMLSDAGVRRGDRVLLHLADRTNVITGEIACLSIGASFVPVDPTMPPARAEMIAEDSGGVVVLHDGPGTIGARRSLDIAAARDHAPQALQPHESPATDDEAYVIYTSGSTGRPKGVMVSHGALAAFVDAIPHRYDLDSRDRVLAVHSPSFDVSLEEIFPVLVTGGTVVPTVGEHLTSAAAMFAAIERRGVSVLDLPTSLWHELCRGATEAGLELPNCVRLVIIGGEEARADAVRAWLTGPGRRARLVNSYGPTEATIWALTAELDADSIAHGDVPIGTPLPSVDVRIAAEDSDGGPEGTVGELWLGGPQLASGYHDRDELTRSRFIIDAGGRRWYRTGDKVRRRDDGSLVYLGRLDDQVKIRGHRIEPREVESVLNALPGVHHGAVIVDRSTAEPTLVAFYAGDASAEEIRRQLAAALPVVMVPDAIEQLSELPLNTSGKVDRPALTARHINGNTPAQHSDDAATAPSVMSTRLDSIVQAVIAMAGDLVGRAVRAEDRFFAVGGHSLLALRLVNRIQQRFGVDITFAEFTDAPDMRSLAVLIDEAMPAQSLVVEDAGATSAPAATSIDAPRRLHLTSAPLTRSQERFFVAGQRDGDAPAYSTVIARRLLGPLDVEALAVAWDHVVHRHESLRTAYALDHRGEPGQFVLETGPMLEAHDVEDVDTWMATVCNTPLRLDVPPVRAVLGCVSRKEHLLVIVVHHIAVDEHALAVIQHDLARAYRTASGLTDAGDGDELGVLDSDATSLLSMTDLAVWQRGQERTERWADHLRWWHETIPEDLPAVELPNWPTLEVSRTVGHHEVQIPGDIAGPLIALGRAGGSTDLAIALTITSLWLSAVTSSDRIVLCVPATERNVPGCADIVGSLVNTVPVMIALDPAATVASAFDVTRRQLAAAIDHSQIPFESAMVARDRRARVGQVLVNVEPQRQRSLDWGSVHAERVNLAGRARSAKAELVVWARVDGDRLSLRLEHPGVAAETLERMSALLLAMLGAAAADPSTRIRSLPLVEPAMERWLREAVDAQNRPYPSDSTLDELLRESVACHRDALAIVDGERSITYDALDLAVSVVSTELARRGVGPGHVVGVIIPRSLEYVVATLAVIRAGAMYLPVDVSFPAKRQQELLDRATVSVTIQTGGDIDPLIGAAIQVVGIAPLEPPHPIGHGGDRAAYVMFTSGSTGHPKGVVVPSRGVVRLVVNCNYTHIGPGDVVAFANNPAFDASTFEMWGALLNGARLEIVRREQLLDPEQLEHFARSRGITHLLITTALFNTIAAVRPSVFAGIDTVLFGGEACDEAAIERVLGEAAPKHLINVYGPTECTTFATVSEIAAVGPNVPPPSIGCAINGTNAYVMDRHGRLVPPMAVGELWLGGAGLALGYLGDPDATASKFVLHHTTGERLYRTGDLVRRRHDGEIEFVGRADRQVKLRGHRIELDEVERRLVELAPARDAVVDVRAGSADGSNESRLVAWISVSDPASFSVEQLVDRLHDSLPAYMVPSSIAVLAELPINSNGKVDRASLMASVPTTPARIASQGTRLEVVLSIWRRHLGDDASGVDDSFFDRGGSSLQIIRAAADLSSALGIQVPLSAMHEHPTPAALDRWLSKQGSTTDGLRTMAGADPMVVFLPPADGDPFVYDRMREQIEPTRASVVIPLRGWDGSVEPDRDLIVIADRMEVLVSQAVGARPFVFVGYSLGGILGVELAKRLERRGQVPHAIMMIDVAFPMTFSDRLRRLWNVRVLRRRPRATMSEEVANHDSLYRTLMHAAWAAIADYSPPRRIRPKLVLITSRPSRAARRWTRRARGNAVTEIVQARHSGQEGVVTGENAERVGRIVSDHLRELDRSL